MVFRGRFDTCGFFVGCFGGYRGEGGLWEKFVVGRYRWGIL